MRKILLITIPLLTINLLATDISNFLNLKNCDQIIDKQIYKICYSYKHKGALAVWYELNGDLVHTKNIKKRTRFYNEKSIPMKYRTKYKDYTNSGYDRGHLAPDANFDYDKKSLTKTYTMANIVPQSPDFNRRIWLKAEKYERQIASKLNTAYVINLVDYNNFPEKIGDNISVPFSFTKIILNDNHNFQKCLRYENAQKIEAKGNKLKNHTVECSTLKKD